LEELKSQSESCLHQPRKLQGTGEKAQSSQTWIFPLFISAHPTGVPRSSQAARGAAISPSLPALLAAHVPGAGALHGVMAWVVGEVMVDTVTRVLLRVLPGSRGKDELLSKSSLCTPAGHSTFISVTMGPNPMFSPA